MPDAFTSLSIFPYVAALGNTCTGAAWYTTVRATPFGTTTPTDLTTAVLPGRLQGQQLLWCAAKQQPTAALEATVIAKVRCSLAM